MAQSGGVRKRKYKDTQFSRKVVLLKNGNQCISFSDMDKIESKAEIEFTSSMTQNDAQKKIQETFPYLKNKRFSCAALVRVDNDHKKFESHGSQRVWDGETIKKHIKGKSNLYILEEESSDCKLSSSDDDDTPTSGISESDLEFSEKSEDNNNADARPNLNSSDTGFDEGMDIDHDLSGNNEPSNFSFSGDLPTYPCLETINTEEDNCLSDTVITPPSQMFETSNLDSALEEICSDGISDKILDEGLNLFRVVQDICPTSGSVKGGYQFQISLTEELPDDVKSGVADFKGVAHVMVHKLNPYTLVGIVPPSKVPDEVPVFVTTDAGQQLGMTLFRYVDEMRVMARQLVKDPTLQSLWFAVWLEEFRLLVETDSNISQVQGPLNMQDQDSSVQTKQQQSVKILQLLVYTAAQTDVRQFLEMVFSTSAGQIVFNSYKDRTPLPEDIARANGHDDLAQFLQDTNTRLSKVTSIDVQCDAIDWLELVKAAQNQSSISQDVSTKQLNPTENDDNSSDYFADAETSSCGSFDHDTGSSDISEHKGPCIRDGESIQLPTEKPEEGTPNKKPVKKWAQLDNEGDKENVSIWGLTHSFPEWLSKQREREDTSSIQEGKGDGSTETNSASKTPKKRESTPGRPASNNFQCTVTQNRHIQASMTKLQMERVRSWLACDLGQEEPGEDGGGNTDGTLNNGNHEANRELDLQNQKQCHPAALSFNKGNMARADQHQDFDVPGSLTDNIDENGFITSESGSVEVSDECSSSSEEEFTTSGISEGDFVLTEGNTDDILNTGNHEANGEPDLQNEEQGHPVALSFNKGDVARADQHQDSNIPGSLTDNIDDDGSIIASHEPGQVEVSDVCSSSSEEKFTTSGISEGKDVLLHVIEEDTRCIHSIADGMAQAGIAPLAVKGYMAPEVCIMKSGEMHADISSFGCVSALEALCEDVKLLHRCFSEGLLGASQAQITRRYLAEAFARICTHRYLAEAFARNCLEILKCSATLSLQKEAYQHLHLLIRKYCRGNSQGRDLEREPTEQRAVGGQPSDEVNYAIVPRRVTATGFQKQSRGTPVSGLLLQELKQSETDPTKRLSLVKQSAVNNEAVDDSFLDCIDCFVGDDSPVGEHLNKLEDGVQQNVTLFNIPGIASSVDDEAMSPMEQLLADIHNLHSLDQAVIHKDIKGKDVLLHVVDEDTRCIHPIADGMAQAGIVPLGTKGYVAPEVCTITSRDIFSPFIAIIMSFVPKTASERTLQEQICTHRCLAEVLARDCLEILKCSATLSLRKEVYQRLRLLIRKYRRSRKGKRERLSIETHFHDH